MAVIPSQKTGKPIQGDMTDHTQRGLVVRKPKLVGKAALPTAKSPVILGSDPRSKAQFNARPTANIVQPSQRGFPLPVNPGSRPGYRDLPPMLDDRKLAESYNGYRSQVVTVLSATNGGTNLDVKGKAFMLNLINPGDGPNGGVIRIFLNDSFEYMEWDTRPNLVVLPTFGFVGSTAGANPAIDYSPVVILPVSQSNTWQPRRFILKGFTFYKIRLVLQTGTSGSIQVTTFENLVDIQVQ